MSSSPTKSRRDRAAQKELKKARVELERETKDDLRETAAQKDVILNKAFREVAEKHKGKTVAQDVLARELAQVTARLTMEALTEQRQAQAAAEVPETPVELTADQSEVIEDNPIVNEAIDAFIAADQQQEQDMTTIIQEQTPAKPSFLRRAINAVKSVVNTIVQAVASLFTSSVKAIQETAEKCQMGVVRYWATAIVAIMLNSAAWGFLGSCITQLVLMVVPPMAAAAISVLIVLPLAAVFGTASMCAIYMALAHACEIFKQALKSIFGQHQLENTASEQVVFA